MRNLHSFNQQAFTELVRQVVGLTWGGKVGSENNGSAMFSISIDSHDAPAEVRGTWDLLPVPGEIQRMNREEAADWIVNLTFRETKNFSAGEEYAGPGILVVPASAELADQVQPADIAAAYGRTPEGRRLPRPFLIRILSPALFTVAANQTPSIRRAFRAAEEITDALREVTESSMQNVARGARSAIGSASRQLRNSVQISLTQAGGTGDENAQLATVFFDPRAEAWQSPGLGREIRVCTAIVQSLDSPYLAHSLSGRTFRLVLVGGPGQGKSTAAQFLAQLYRASFVTGQPEQSAVVREAAAATLARAHALEIPIPVFRRWPIHVSLARYAEYLTKYRSTAVMGVGGDSGTTTREGLLAYILSKEPQVESESIGGNEFRAWLKEWPSVVLLDGMDETPPELRNEIRERIDDFEEVVSQLGADIGLVITSRPQGNSTDFAFDRWLHYRLVDLDSDEATTYAREIVKLSHDIQSDDGIDLLDRLTSAIASPITSRLAHTPLQITILTLLFQQDIGAQSRFQLFDGYFTVVFRRESNKQGALGEFVRSHRHVLEEVHERIAFVLHLRSEQGIEPVLSDRELGEVLVGVLQDRGYAHDAVLPGRLRATIIDRLVLLVSPREGKWHFEVRILEEYMTARHWTSGIAFSEGQLVNILEKTAALQFWRTVWSLAAGRILADRPMYRNALLAILAGSNAASPLAISTRPASRLAIDLLLDDVAANRPKDARNLISLALDNLQDLSLESVHGLVDALMAIFNTDAPTQQIFNDHVARVGTGWSLERVALTALLRTMRRATNRDAMKRRIDLWLRSVGNNNDKLHLELIGENLRLDKALRMALIQVRLDEVPVNSFSSTSFNLYRDSLGTGYVLDRDKNISAVLAEAIGEALPVAEWIAVAESLAKPSSPRLAKQLRDGLAQWAGLKTLQFSVDQLGNPK